MKQTTRYLGSLLGALVLVGAYWGLDRGWGPFATVRRYGMGTAGVNWANRMPPGEWLWYLAAFLATAAVWWCLLTWPRRGEPAARATRRTWRLAGLVVAACVAAACLRFFVLDAAPTTDDEMVYQFQARTLASGRWTADPPPNLKAFQFIFLGVYHDRWFGQYSYGHPAFLALGEWFGAIGLVGPVLAGLIVLMVFLLARRLFDERTAWVAAFLAALSPMMLSTGATLLSQNSATFLVLLGLFLTLTAVESGRFVHAFGAALSLGAAFWCRQQEPALLGAGPIALLLWRIWRGPNRRPLFWGGLSGSILAIGSLAVLQGHLWDNPFWTNYQAYWWGHLGYVGHSPFGFIETPWTKPHSPAAGLRYTLQNLARLDFYLLGLPGALALAVYSLLKHRRQKAVLAAFLGVPLTFVVLFFYFFSGIADTGPQFYHAAGAVLLPFVAAGGLALATRWKRSVAWLLTAAAVVAAASFWPAHVGALHRLGRAGNEIPRLIQNQGITHALVFMEKYPWIGGHERCFVLGRPMPRPDLSDDVLYLQSQGTPQDRAVAEQFFPGRKLYTLRQVDGLVAVLPLDEYAGADSLRLAAQPRDLPR